MHSQNFPYCIRHLQNSEPNLLPMSVAIRPPGWVSHRRLLEQKLSDLHKCSDLNHIKQLHVQIFKAALERDPFIAPKLISAYSLCHQMAFAVSVFNQVQEPNTLLYNTLIRAYNHNSQSTQAFYTFFEMQKNSLVPDNFTYPFLLKACSGRFALPQVEMIHTHVVKLGFLSDIFVPNTLIDSYSKCGTLGTASARKLFDAMPQRDIVSWNSMLAGLVRAGELKEARRAFDEMPERDTVSWNTLLDGHTKAGEMDIAFELFERMPARNIISWSSLVLGYCKKGDMEMARLMFNKMPSKSLVPWTIMISGYAEKGFAKEASSLFCQMEESGLKADKTTILSILAACAESGLLGFGKMVHKYMQRMKMNCTTQLCNALLDMYAKCGNLDKAWSIFDGMVSRDVVSWNSMIQGLAIHGHGERALHLFERMKRESIMPDGLTFIGVLCACTHVGLVEEGRRHFSSMERDYGLVPEIEHYGCVIDLLGRGGLLKEAYELAKSMPLEPNVIIWGSLLSACRTHNNVGLAEEVVNQLIKLVPSEAGSYAMLSNIYAAVGRWDGVARARLQMKGTNFQKPSGSSSIEVDNVMHEFTVGDRSHPQYCKIFRMLDQLGKHLKQLGNLPKGD